MAMPSPGVFVFRLREAFAGWAPGRVMRVQAGVVPTLTIPEIEGTWRLRAVAPTALEQTGLCASADLGATVRATLPGTFGWVGVGAYNGEGYSGRELNRSTSVELAASASRAVPEGTEQSTRVSGLRFNERPSGALGLRACA